MAEPKPIDTAAPMSRTGFLKHLALLAGAFALIGPGLSSLFRRAEAGPRLGPDPRPAAAPRITPPTRSVKRRG